MSWDKLESKNKDKSLAEQREKLAALAKSYARCFSTQEGKAVLDHLVNTYVMENNTGFSSPNINYESAYRNGEAGLVKQILNQIKRAQSL
jgi:predicted Zn-dependent peptidase